MASRWLGIKAWKYSRLSSLVEDHLPVASQPTSPKSLTPAPWAATAHGASSSSRSATAASAAGGVPISSEDVTGAGWPWVTMERSCCTLSETVTGECQPGTRLDRDRSTCSWAARIFQL
ncbi:hypothetical protein D9M72_496620 [compost metagenome]